MTDLKVFRFVRISTRTAALLSILCFAGTTTTFAQNGTATSPVTTTSSPSTTTTATPATHTADEQSATAPSATPSTGTPATGTKDQQSQPQSTTAPAASSSSTTPTDPQATSTQDSSASPASAASDTTAAGNADNDKDKKDKKKKDKDEDKKPSNSEDNVDAIGNRNIGGRGLGNWYSIEREVKEGKAYAQQVEQTVKLIDDPVVTEYVNRIGQNLVRNSDAKVPFTIKVVDDDSINAFALPGGFFYVNSGLILAADSESELAGVMAHEIAHVAAHHAMRQQTRANYAQMAMIPIMVMGGGVGYAAYEAANLALPLTFLQFSRNFEAEADFLGVQYMYKAGYDPQAFVDFFEKVEAQEKKRPGAVAKAFSSHPQTPDRIEKSQEEIQKLLPSRAQYVVTTSEFDQVKARLAAIENKRKLNDEKDSGKPTLRRASADDSKDKSTKTDDDRPTLKRRDQ